MATDRSPLHGHEELVVGKAFDRELMGRLLRYATPYRWPMGQAIILIIVTTALGISGPIIVTYALDNPLAAFLEQTAAERTDGGEPDPAGDPRRDSSADDGAAASEIARRDAVWQLAGLSGLFVAVSVTLMLLRFRLHFTMAEIGQRVMYDLRMELFAHLQRMPFAFYDRTPVGRLVTRITNDIEALNELFASGIVTLVADVLVLIGITIVLLLMNLKLALVTLGVLPLLLFATFVFRNRARKYYREQRGHIAHLGAFAQESVQGMNLLQLFHRETENMAAYRDINLPLMHSFKRSVVAYSIYFPVVEFLGKTTLIVIIWQVSRQLQAGEVTLAGLYFFWVFLERFFQPIRDMAERYNVLQSAMAAAERIFTVLDAPETIVKEDASAAPVPPIDAGHIEFNNVWFSYTDDEQEYVLKDISFTVEKGTTVAIVGATGSGKSTIINLLSRFYDPQRGRVCLDGVDIRHMNKRELRRRIGVVLQDVFLFSRSIRENIRLGHESVTDDQVEAAARLVNAEPFIRRQPNGYDTVLSERGGTLSVGEKQLLAFARTLAHDPEFLVLDEATASVDTETEALIQDALSKLLKGRTSIVIAHRLSTIRKADRILVMHKGEIREEGSHAELLRLGGIYSRLHELQYRP